MHQTNLWEFLCLRRNVCVRECVYTQTGNELCWSIYIIFSSLFLLLLSFFFVLFFFSERSCSVRFLIHFKHTDFDSSMLNEHAHTGACPCAWTYTINVVSSLDIIWKTKKQLPTCFVECTVYTCLFKYFTTFAHWWATYNRCQVYWS